MKPSQLFSLLAQTIPARLPVLIVGGPGVGKTSIVDQACVVADNDLVVSQPATEDPTVPAGLPWAEKGAKHASFLPFGNTARVLESTKPTVWLWDDFGMALPAIQSAYMPWLFARGLNGHKLPDHVTIIATTNRRTDKGNVSGILEPVKSRFATIVTLESDLDEWTQWALMQPFMPPELVAYLRFTPERLDQFVPTADLTNSPVPRTWENAGKVLSLKMSAAVEAMGMIGAVGEGAAAEALGFIRMYRELPSVDGILIDPDTALVPTNVSALYAVATALASRATELNFGRVGRYAQRLYDAGFGDFAALIVKDSARRTPAVQQTPAFVLLMSGEVGKLITGG